LCLSTRPTIAEGTADATDFFPVGTLYKKIRFMLSFDPENCPGEEDDFVLSDVAEFLARRRSNKKISFPILTS
jgi:hypothetical protein